MDEEIIQIESCIAFTEMQIKQLEIDVVNNDGKLIMTNSFPTIITLSL